MNDSAPAPDAISRLEEIDAEERRRIAVREAERTEFLTIMEAVVEALPDALILSNEAGEIILANREAELMFHYHRSDMIGQRIEMLLPPQARDRHIVERDQYFQEPYIRHIRAGRLLPGLRRDGRIVHVEIMLSPVVTRRGIYVLAVLRRRHGEAPS